MELKFFQVSRTKKEGDKRIKDIFKTGTLMPDPRNLSRYKEK